MELCKTHIFKQTTYTPVQTSNKATRGRYRIDEEVNTNQGYEEMDRGNNLLVCLGFIGKMASNSSSRFKIKTDDVVELMGNKGIRLIKPIKINPEEYAGLEWNL